MKRYQQPFITLLLAITTLFLFEGCKKPPIHLPGNGTADTTQLKKLELDEQHYRTFMYDNMGRFRRMELWSLGMMNYVEAVYESSNRIERIKTGDFQIKPGYTGTKITAIGYVQHQVPDNDDPDIFRALQYDGNNITECRRYEVKSGLEVDIDKYSFTHYPNGDVKEIRLLYYDRDQKQFQLHAVIQLEYDEMKNPLQKTASQFPWLYDHYEIFQVFLQGSHNITRLRQYNNAGELMALKKFSYAYSAAGYPLTATEKGYDETATDPLYTHSIKYYY